MTGTPNAATSFKNFSSNNIPVGFIGELIKIAAVCGFTHLRIASISYCRYSLDKGTKTGLACVANTKLR